MAPRFPELDHEADKVYQSRESVPQHAIREARGGSALGQTAAGIRASPEVVAKDLRTLRLFPGNGTPGMVRGVHGTASGGFGADAVAGQGGTATRKERETCGREGGTVGRHVPQHARPAVGRVARSRDTCHNIRRRRRGKERETCGRAGGTVGRT
jgi:hypothetical protein